MDYPFYRRQRHNISNNWWFLPTDFFGAGEEIIDNNHRKSTPILSYIDDISDKNKFKYLVIGIFIIVFIYHLDLKSNIWIGLIIAIFSAYFFNEKNDRSINDEADQIWSILNGPLLKNSKYFITDPQLIRWVNDVSEFKQYNILIFNKMIKTIDHMLRLVRDVKKGVHYCSENIDIIQDLRSSILNQFHSLIHNISISNLRLKLNYYLEQLAKLLNDHISKLLKVCKLYYMQKPIDIESKFDITKLNDPLPFDSSYEPNYNFYT